MTRKIPVPLTVALSAAAINSASTSEMGSVSEYTSVLTIAVPKLGSENTSAKLSNSTNSAPLKETGVRMSKNAITIASAMGTTLNRRTDTTGSAPMMVPQISSLRVRLLRCAFGSPPAGRLLPPAAAYAFVCSIVRTSDYFFVYSLSRDCVARYSGQR